MNLEKKIRSMKPSEIIMAMVNGLKNATIEIDMLTYGEIRTNGKPRCFGCAATCTILHIADVTPDPEELEFFDAQQRAEITGLDNTFLGEFENAIDDLRMGDVEDYNYFFASEQNMEEIPLPDYSLPYLDNENWKAGIVQYEGYAQELASQGL